MSEGFDIERLVEGVDYFLDTTKERDLNPREIRYAGCVIPKPKERGMKKSAKKAVVSSEITDEWLRSLGMKAFKQLGGEYRENQTSLLIEKDSGFDRSFWVLDFNRNNDGGAWTVMLKGHDHSGYGGSSKFLALIQLADVSTNDDVIAILKVFGLPKETMGEDE